MATTTRVNDVPVLELVQYRSKTRVISIRVVDPETGLPVAPGEVSYADGEFIMYRGSEAPVVRKNTGNGGVVFVDRDNELYMDVTVEAEDWPAVGVWCHETDLIDAGGDPALVLRGTIDLRHTGFDN